MGARELGVQKLGHWLKIKEAINGIKVSNHATPSKSNTTTITPPRTGKTLKTVTATIEPKIIREQVKISKEITFNGDFHVQIGNRKSLFLQEATTKLWPLECTDVRAGSIIMKVEGVPRDITIAITQLRNHGLYLPSFKKLVISVKDIKRWDRTEEEKKKFEEATVAKIAEKAITAVLNRANEYKSMAEKSDKEKKVAEEALVIMMNKMKEDSSEIEKAQKETATALNQIVKIEKELKIVEKAKK